MPEGRDWVTPVALLGGVAALGYGAYMVFKKKEEEKASITIDDVTATPYQPNYDGDTVDISVLITNHTDEDMSLDVNIEVHQGAIVGSGSLVPGGEQTQSISIAANSQISVDFQHTCTDIGGDATRDIWVVVFADNESVADKRAGNRFRVEGALSVSLGETWVNPYQPYYDGDTVTIHVPVTNQGNANRNVTITINIQQGGLIWSNPTVPGGIHEQVVTLSPGQTVDVAFEHTCVALEGDATRDIYVQLFIDGVQVDDDRAGNRYRVEGYETQLSITRIETSPKAGVVGDTFDIAINIYNSAPGGLTETFDMLVEIIYVPTGQLTTSWMFNSINIDPYTVLSFRTYWVASSSGIFRAEAKLIKNGQVIFDYVTTPDPDGSYPNLIPVNQPTLERGSFSILPMNPLSDIDWSCIWMTTEGNYTSGILGWLTPATFGDVPLTGRLAVFFYIVPGYAEQFGPTDEVTLEDLGGYRYNESTNTLIKVS